MKQIMRTWFTLENLLVGLGVIGLFSAIQLTLEKFNVLENPTATLSCDLNPILSCGSVITTEQASAFSFPNPIIGVAGFSAVITIGMAIKAGARFDRWFWRGLQIGVLFGIGFVHWLMYQSIFTIQALCPYCMVVWAAMIPLFVYVTRHNLAHRHIPNFLGNSRPLLAYQVVLLWYLAVIGVILYEFWYYWQTVAPFSWFV